MSARFQEVGLEVNVFECDPHTLADVPGWTASVDDYRSWPNMVADWPETAVWRSLILKGHIDTVPADPKELCTYGPWSPPAVRYRIYARGALENQGAGVVRNSEGGPWAADGQIGTCWRNWLAHPRRLLLFADSVARRVPGYASAELVEPVEPDRKTGWDPRSSSVFI